MRETDELWVRANRPGLALMLDVFTNAVEFGAFTYRVSHENGVVVRTAPGLDAPAIKVCVLLVVWCGPAAAAAAGLEPRFFFFFCGACGGVFFFSGFLSCAYSVCAMTWYCTVCGRQCASA